MREPTIDPRHLETWAGILLDHSLGGITPEDPLAPMTGDKDSF